MKKRLDNRFDVDGIGQEMLITEKLTLVMNQCMYMYMRDEGIRWNTP